MSSNSEDDRDDDLDEVEDDEVSEDMDSEEEEERRPPSSAGRKRGGEDGGGRGGGAGGAAGAKRRRRSGGVGDVSRFFELEAKDTDEEGSEEEEEVEELFADEAAEAEALATATRERERTRRAMVAEALGGEDGEEDVRAKARELEERYRYYGRAEYGGGEGGAEERGEIAQQSFLPSVRDPKLWLIKCKKGKERETVVCLMQKYFDVDGTDRQLLIKSASCADNLKGYIYVEAEKEIHVKQAITGLRNLIAWDLKLVPLKEMTAIFTVAKKALNLRRDAWVRIKRGTYKGDLAQVLDVDETRARVTVRLIPRLDLTKLHSVADLDDDEDDDDATAKRKRKTRPPQRFFNDEEVRKLAGSEVESRPSGRGGKYFVFAMQKFKDGFLHKPMNIKSLETDNIEPTLDELQKFQAPPSSANGGGDDDDDGAGSAAVALSSTLSALAKSQQQGGGGAGGKKRGATFIKGDAVAVVEGELKHLMGIVESVSDNMVTILPKHEALHDLLTFPAEQLTKYVKMGDHVKVISGRFEGETGLILRVDGNIVTIFSDLTMKEIQVLAQDIQEATEVAAGNLQLGNYELHDLVQIDPQTVGMIVKVERDSFRIMDTAGKVTSYPLQAIQNKRTNRHAVAFDKNQSQVTVGDVLQVVEGPLKGRQGTVRHIHRYFAFLHSNAVLDNTGIFVVRVASTTVLGGGKNRAARPGPSPSARGGAHSAGGGGYGHHPMSGMPSPSRSLTSPSRSLGSGPPGAGGGPRGRPQDPAGGRGRGGGGGRGRGRGREDSLIHKTVTVGRGPWKGYVGIVVDATDNSARVELHTNCKTVNVDRTFLTIIDAEGRREPATAAGAASGGFQEGVPATPSWASSRTPMRGDGDGSATPMRAGTPMRSSTPSHDAWNPTTPSRATSWDDNPVGHHHHPNEYGSIGGSYGIGAGGYAQSSSSSSSPSAAAAITPFSPFSPAPVGRDRDDQMLLPRTPSEGIYNPATPSGGYTPHFTPMESHYTPDQPTPRGGPNEVSTPGYTPYTATPQAYPATPATPGIPQTPGTPGMMSLPSLARASAPATPGMISYDSDLVDTTNTVAGGVMSTDEPWTTEGIEVRVSDAYRGGQYSQASAVITSAGRDSCRVTMRDRDGNDLESLSIPSPYLEPVVPAKKDRVKVIRGELKGNVGLLVGIDGSDGIVKMEPNLDIKLLALPLLARYHHRK